MNSNISCIKTTTATMSSTKTAASQILAAAIAAAQMNTNPNQQVKSKNNKSSNNQQQQSSMLSTPMPSPTAEEFGIVQLPSASASNPAANLINANPSSFTKLANKDSLLVHYYCSTLQEMGLQALIVPTVESAIGLPGRGLPSPVLAKHVYIQLAEKGCGFSSFEMAKNKGQTLVIPLDIYMQLLNFFANDFVLVEKKIKHEIEIMKNKSQTVFIENGLGFLGHGYCIYKHFFNNETILDIRAESESAQAVFFIHLTYKQKQPMPLYPKMMTALAMNLPTLLNTFSD